MANLPVKVPCDTFKDPEVLAGTKRPACWDPGWNTHTHYVAEGPGKILAVNEERRRGIGTLYQANYHGVSFYDISNPASPKFLSRWQAPISDPVDGESPDADGTHHFNFRNQGQPGFLNNNDNRYLFLGTEYKGYIGMILVILDARDPRHPVEAATWHIPGTEDAGRGCPARLGFPAELQQPDPEGPRDRKADQARGHALSRRFTEIQPISLTGRLDWSSWTSPTSSAPSSFPGWII